MTRQERCHAAAVVVVLVLCLAADSLGDKPTLWPAVIVMGVGLAVSAGLVWAGNRPPQKRKSAPPVAAGRDAKEN